MIKPRPAGIQNSDIFIDLRRGGAGRAAEASAPGGTQVHDVAFETVRARKGPKPIWVDLRIFSLDGVYAFVLFAAMLFVAEAGSLSGLAMAVLPLLYVALRRRRLGHMLSRCWILFTIPAFALVSSVWSEAPDISAKAAAEMWLTALAGVTVAGAVRPTAVLKGLCLAFATYVVVSLGFGHRVEVGSMGDAAFAGLGDSKNLLADISATGALLSLATLFVSIRQRHHLWWTFALCAFVLEAYVLIMARSAGATMATAAAMVIMFGLWVVSAVPRAGRATVVALVLVSGGVMAAFIRTLGTALLGAGSALFDKDPTLTGRTYLWYRAHDLIAEKPWLGHGFQAFWRQGNTDAEGLWQFAGILGRAGFNFHNTLVEVAVQLGWIGAGLYCLVGLVGLIGLVRHFVAQPTGVVCLWITYMTYIVIRAPLETEGFPFYFSTVLLFAAAGSGLAKLPPRLKPRQRFTPQAVRLRHFYAAREARGVGGQAFPAPAE